MSSLVLIAPALATFASVAPPCYLGLLGSSLEAYDEFKAGVSDRTASVRLPANVATDGCGYLEDRRPNANACPYEVARVMLETVCGLHE